ncbi:MAG: hypothetical protein P9M03_12865 [Candidatus Theseobacter exili]|nr:hypothetical protein [Candidatus Theseobacter exili]
MPGNLKYLTNKRKSTNIVNVQKILNELNDNQEMNVMNNDLQKTHDQFVEKMGFLGSLFGFSKLMGQIYGALYLSPDPMSLNDIMEQLSVSKGSVSINIRELEKWGGCKKVWVKGDRKDYYEAEINFRNIINKRLVDAMKRRMFALDEISQLTKTDAACSKMKLEKEDKLLLKFYETRLRKIESFKKKADILLRTVAKLL